MDNLTHLVIVSPYTDLRTSPSVYGFVQYVLAAGGEVTIFAPGPAENVVDYTHPALTVLGDFPNWRSHGIWRLLSPEQYVGGIAWRKKIRHRWSAMVAIDPLGLINAQWLLRYVKLPVWYWSLEILYDDELEQVGGKFNLWREGEKRLLSGCSGGIIQDEGRAKEFRGQNPAFISSKMVQIPNSFPGKAKRTKGGYLHEKLNIPQTAKIVLYAGSFSASNRVDDIVLSTSSWPEDWVLVVHTRHPVGSGELLFAQRLLEKVAPPGRVYFSTEPVSVEAYQLILDSADIGLSFYAEDPALVLSLRNTQCMGYASGKVNSYLQAGLPVIVNDYTDIRQWVKETECGLAISSIDEIGAAIRKIDADMETYSANAVHCFNSRLAVEKGYQDLLDQI